MLYKNQLKFLALVFIFVAPFIAAQLYYNYGHHQGGSTNFGTLLRNPHNISELGIDDNQPNNTVYNSKKWQALYLAPDSCDNTCEQVLYQLQQVHVAMGKNIHRFQPIVLHKIISIKHKDKNWEQIHQKYIHTISRTIKTNNNILKVNTIYLADPNGNIILSYAIENKNFAEQILKDSKKLMSLSKIG